MHCSNAHAMILFALRNCTHTHSLALSRSLQSISIMSRINVCTLLSSSYIIYADVFISESKAAAAVTATAVHVRLELILLLYCY